MKRVLAMFLVFLLLGGVALAEAPDITKQVKLSPSAGSGMMGPMKDRNTKTFYNIMKGCYLEVTSQENMTALSVEFYKRATAFEIQVGKGDQWISVAKCAGERMSDGFLLPQGTQKLRIVNTDAEDIYLMELYVYGEGETPSALPLWEEPSKADIMLLTAHPDDELVWFGGLLPTYAGEKDVEVQVACMTPVNEKRRRELLQAIWHCGVETYPLFGGMKDNRVDSLQGQYRYWKQEKALESVVRMIRQVKPEVLITHDVEGEYGHGAHRVCADISKIAIHAAADPTQFPETAALYGTWQVKKLYIHLYEENPIVMDWHQPLASFGGKDGITVANEALQFHRSQVIVGWDHVKDGGQYDSAKFGLYYSAVGPDTGKCDFLENIHTPVTPTDLSPLQKLRQGGIILAY